MKKIIDRIRIAAFFVALMSVMLMNESLVGGTIAVAVLAVAGWQLSKVDTSKIKAFNEVEG